MNRRKLDSRSWAMSDVVGEEPSLLRRDKTAHSEFLVRQLLVQPLKITTAPEAHDLQVHRTD